MYIVFVFMSVIIIFIDLWPRKKLRYRNDVKLMDKLNIKLSRLHYKNDGKFYKKLQQEIINSGISISMETFQSIRIIFPFAAVLFYIVFKIINYVNLYVNMNELEEAAKILNDNSILDISLKFSLIEITVIAFTALLIPNIILRFMTKVRIRLSKRESLILQTYAIMLLKTSKPVKQILISLHERANYFKPILETSINKFSSDPDEALKELKDLAPQQSDFVNICIALQQALNGDKQLSITYLENHRNLSREVNKQIRIRSQTRNQGIGILLMMIPLAISIAVVGYPWLMYTIRAISSIPI